MKKIQINIPLKCPPKKNSQNIIYNPRTHKPMIIQSKQYKEFESLCEYYLDRYRGLHIDYPINLCCVFYVPDKRRRDIVNLLNAMQDILVKYDVLEDDNSNIISRLDGSRIVYQKGRGETQITITNLEEAEND